MRERAREGMRHGHSSCECMCVCVSTSKSQIVQVVSMLAVPIRFTSAVFQSKAVNGAQYSLFEFCVRREYAATNSSRRV